MFDALLFWLQRVQIISILTANMQLNNNMFPSFAVSPSLSPQKSLQSSLCFSTSKTPTQTNHHKISIHLPQSLVQSTFDQNISLQQSSKNNKNSIDNIRVYCRFKPGKILGGLRFDHSMVDDGENCYSFDEVFGGGQGQGEIYRGIVGRHLDGFFGGQNSTIFAYGQTGSGKTYTMFGDVKQQSSYGLIPRFLTEIFNRKTNQTITCSILQIYNQKLIDLFNPLHKNPEVKLKQQKDTVYLQNLIEVQVQNENEIMELIKFGMKDRKVAMTHNNDCSSRSHTVIFVYRAGIVDGREVRNKICFVDLAGSEKVRKSGVKGQNLEETKKINLSLSCLGNVVNALTNSSDHIPYRNSKLTRILKDSLCGQSKTSIITTCSLDKQDINETLSTLKFAVRAKRIKNKKKLSNAGSSMEEVIENLKKELAVTKKELDYYKKREVQDDDQEEFLGEIADQKIQAKPIKISTVNGVGILSRLKSSQRLI